MKKFCSKCGTQLDLGKKSCTTCHAFNPYFIAGFTSNESEPLTENQVPVINTAIIEEPEWQKENAAEIEGLKLEQQEQHKAELELKKQLLKVQEETEQFKKETFNLVKDVQKELHDIEKENKLLKEKVELLKTSAPVQRNDASVYTNPVIPQQKNEPKRGVTAIAAILLLIIVTGASYYFFSNTNKKPTTNSSNQSFLPSGENKGMAQKSVVTDSASSKKLLAVASVPASVKVQPATSKPVSEKMTPAAPVKASSERFSLTESKLKTDLVGKKLSGCDVTIKSSMEVSSISNVVLVDKLSASYLKYKCTLKIKQGTEEFTSTPYIYYSAEGTFIKVDGTNCE